MGIASAQGATFGQVTELTLRAEAGLTEVIRVMCLTWSGPDTTTPVLHMA